MAVGDIWRAKFNCSTHGRGWSFGLWYEEDNPISEDYDGQIVSDAMAGHFTTALRDVLQIDSRFESVQTYSEWTSRVRAGLSVIENGVGTRTGNGMSNTNALHFNLRQTAAPAKHNAGFFIGGQSQSDADSDSWTSAYLVGPVASFAAQVLLGVNAIGPATGSWRAVCLSKTYVPPQTAVGTPFDVTSVRATKRVMSMRARKTRVIGWSN